MTIDKQAVKQQRRRQQEQEKEKDKQQKQQHDQFRLITTSCEAKAIITNWKMRAPVYLTCVWVCDYNAGSDDSVACVVVLQQRRRLVVVCVVDVVNFDVRAVGANNFM